MRTDMEKILARNGKIRIICDGHRYRKDKDLAWGSSSWMCLRPACRGRMKISVNDEVHSSTEHNHEPESKFRKALQCRDLEKLPQIVQQTSTVKNWMLVEPRDIEKLLSKLYEIFHREANPLFSQFKH